jgi:integrase
VKGRTFQLRFTDEQGKLRYKTFAKRKLAADWYRNGGYKEALEGAEDEPTTGVLPTVGDALDAWLRICEHVGRNGRDPVEASTIRNYGFDAAALKVLPVQLEKDAAPVLAGGIALITLSAPVMVLIRDALLKTHSRNHAKTLLVSLKGALAEAETRGDIPYVPGRSVSITMGSRHRERAVIPEPSEITRILESAFALTTAPHLYTRRSWVRYRPLLELATFSGMRPSELRGLPRRNIDVAGCLVKITQRADRFGRIGPPKTTAGIRTIYIPKRVAALLGEYLALLPDDPNYLVFGTSAGTPIAHANLTVHCWQVVCEQAGLLVAGKPRYTLYHLRHHRASTEIAMGASAKEIQVLMGHENIQTTMQVYGHLFAEAEQARRERVQQMDTVLATNLPQTISEPSGKGQKTAVSVGHIRAGKNAPEPVKILPTSLKYNAVLA